jgi:hypothetical protein
MPYEKSAAAKARRAPYVRRITKREADERAGNVDSGQASRLLEHYSFAKLRCA